MYSHESSQCFSFLNFQFPPEKWLSWWCFCVLVNIGKLQLINSPRKQIPKSKDNKLGIVDNAQRKVDIKGSYTLCILVGFLCFRGFLLSGMFRVIKVEAHAAQLSDGKHNHNAKQRILNAIRLDQYNSQPNEFYQNSIYLSAQSKNPVPNLLAAKASKSTINICNNSNQMRMPTKSSTRRTDHDVDHLTVDPDLP